MSLKSFANSEFCPRFISDEEDLAHIGAGLSGKTVVIISTSNRVVSRQNLAMRNLLIARAAKENGARQVVLVEPDLFYSAQDRGPFHDPESAESARDKADLKKFDGQPFTSKLYAQMLKLAGVDRVVTVHNHSAAVQSMFSREFSGQFHHLLPYDIYLDYLRNSDIVSDVATQHLKVFTVGFAAETQDVQQYAIQKLNQKSLNMIVANDISRSDIGFDNKDNEVSVYWHGGEQTLEKATKPQIARQLIQLIAEQFNSSR